jgi:hypothetical protein
MDRIKESFALKFQHTAWVEGLDDGVYIEGREEHYFIIKLGCSHTGLGTSSCNDFCPFTKRDLWTHTHTHTHTHTQREQEVKMQAEIGVTLPQVKNAKDHQKPLTTTNTWKKQG